MAIVWDLALPGLPERAARAPELRARPGFGSSISPKNATVWGQISKMTAQARGDKQ